MVCDGVLKSYCPKGFQAFPALLRVLPFAINCDLGVHQIVHQVPEGTEWAIEDLGRAHDDEA